MGNWSTVKPMKANLGDFQYTLVEFIDWLGKIGEREIFYVSILLYVGYTLSSWDLVIPSV